MTNKDIILDISDTSTDGLLKNIHVDALKASLLYTLDNQSDDSGNAKLVDRFIVLTCEN